MEDSTHISTLAQILELLERLRPNKRRQVLEAAVAFFPEERDATEEWIPIADLQSPLGSPTRIPFSEKRDTTLEEFMVQKNPQTGVEKVMCLAFYLKHYLGVKRFEGADIIRLNNNLTTYKTNEISRRVSDATEQRFLTKFADGKREITSKGEIYVLALPDRMRATQNKIQTTFFERERNGKIDAVPHSLPVLEARNS